MTEFTKKIDEIVQAFSTEATFSAEAMRQFMQLKELSADQEKEIEGLRGDVKSAEKEAQRLREKCNELDKTIDHQGSVIQGWIEREAELKGREADCLRNELTAEFAEKRVEDHQQMFGLVFRNATIRRTRLGQEVGIAPGTPDKVDQYGTIQYGTGQRPEVVGVPVSETTTESEE